MIRFLMDGEIHTLDTFDPTQTVLEWLRETKARTGTKEGCAEGDCGACTVVIGDYIDDTVRYRAVNACIYFLPMLDGKELVTIESLSEAGRLHPVQRAMADGNGTQCGFCTPGFVMSLFARYQSSDEALPDAVDDVLAGNLCRCTGYRPIQAAAAEVSTSDPEIRGRFGGSETVALLRSIAPETTPSGTPINDYADPLFEAKRDWQKPQTETQLAAALVAAPDATLVAGATDVGLWVTKQHRQLDTVIFLDAIDSLKQITHTDNGIEIGAMVRYSDAWAVLQDLHADFAELVRRIGSVQVRNSGTIGGNIANGSPIGDTPPPLIALRAQLKLNSTAGARTLALEDFFIDYGKQDLRAGEYVQSVFIPTPSPDLKFRTYKISKRFNQDISALCAAFALEFDTDTDTVASACIAFGGMAATPKRALKTEAALIGRAWNDATVTAAISELAHDYAPISDMRASSEYRLRVAQNLLRKFYIETTRPTRTRILEES